MFGIDFTAGQVFHFDLAKYLGLHYFTGENFYPWQYVTYMFMHADFSHIFFNMFALWMFGNVMERHWGSKRFLFYFLFCGIGAGFIQNIVNLYQISQIPSLYASQFANAVNTVGASGAVFALLLAFGMTFPNQYIYLYFLIPIKAKWFVIAYGVLELVSGIRGSAIDNVAHFAHLGGMLFGIILILIWKRKDRKHYYY
jgi:membrane associated rhomboid family serine protease